MARRRRSGRQRAARARARSRSRARQRSTRTRRIRAAGGDGPATSESGLSARAMAASGAGGALAQARAALSAMGAPADLNSPGDLAAMRSMAIDAATVAADATGIDIRDPSAPDGIDQAKARQAVSRVLGFDIDAMGGGATPSSGAGDQGAGSGRSSVDRAMDEAIEAAAASAAALGVEIRRPDGSIDPARAREAVHTGLALPMPRVRPVNRAESVAALDRALGVLRQRRTAAPNPV